MSRTLILALAALSLVGLIALGARATSATSSPVTMQPGDTVALRCASSFATSIVTDTLTVACAALPTATETATLTATAVTPTLPPVSTATPVSGVGVCGESLMTWHAPVVNGCATGHEHGDPPPAWVGDAGYMLMYHGGFSTSAAENAAKHAAMKGFSTTLKGVDLYFRIHAASNPLDRSARFHSYEVWARDSSGAVSHWQGWYDSGDPVADRVPRSQPDPGRRPIMLVVDQTSWNQYIRAEQWYVQTNNSWSWDFGWTIGPATTFFTPGENATAADQSTWHLTGALGEKRRLEAAWYGLRGASVPLGQVFYATQFGEAVAGVNDPRCTSTTVKYGVSYQNVCLAQYIAPTMPQVAYPGNAVEKTFDVTGVSVPN